MGSQRSLRSVRLPDCGDGCSCSLSGRHRCRDARDAVGGLFDRRNRSRSTNRCGSALLLHRYVPPDIHHRGLRVRGGIRYRERNHQPALPQSNEQVSAALSGLVPGEGESFSWSPACRPSQSGVVLGRLNALPDCRRPQVFELLGVAAVVSQAARPRPAGWQCMECRHQRCFIIV